MHGAGRFGRFWSAADHVAFPSPARALRRSRGRTGMVLSRSGTKVPGLLLARHRPSTLAFTGPPAHTPDARRAVRFGARRDTTHRGPLEASATDPRTDFGAGEGSARKIPFGSHEPSNHDLSASSRIGSDGTHQYRLPSIASRRTRGAIVRLGEDSLPRCAPAGRFRALRTGVGDAVRSGEKQGRTAGDRPPFPGAPAPDLDLPRDEAGADGGGSAGPAEIGKTPHSPSRRPPDAKPRLPAAILPTVPGLRRAGPDRGGPAIARSGRVVRPVRRPSDRQSPRYHRGGDPREICNQDPGSQAGVFSILRAARAGAR
jgi:hypothetical protein